MHIQDCQGHVHTHKYAFSLKLVLAHPNFKDAKVDFCTIGCAGGFSERVAPGAASSLERLSSTVLRICSSLARVLLFFMLLTMILSLCVSSQ